ncbi:MAG: hypothetical protein JRD84_08845, partial [Deltaproteobacteria bacterium]|nr:hypothetical protein [Deltaproteobacteria bacterium]
RSLDGFAQEVRLHPAQQLGDVFTRGQALAAVTPVQDVVELPKFPASRCLEHILKHILCGDDDRLPDTSPNMGIGLEIWPSKSRKEKIL